MPCEPREIGGPLPEQRVSAAHRGAHARLLAGPGTGKTKTIVDLVVGLIADGTTPERILVLTFTRAAAAGLRGKIRKTIGGDEPPAVYTLHGFALRQLMKQMADIGSGKGRVRVADDWEERNVVLEDLKRMLGAEVKEVRKRLAALASAWETDPRPGVESRHPDHQLLGVLREHKDRYRYVLRSELVYRLKEKLEADPDFDPGTYEWVVVDEYQDLNRCDVAVIDAMANRGATLFVAGDDDQSIYQQLRNAHPQAIRDFVDTHPGAADLRLTVCVRCDAAIVDLARSVIEQEVGRKPKDLYPHQDAGPGQVISLAFQTGREEARGIATLAKVLIEIGIEEHEIMVLLRSDHNGAFSRVIDEEMRGLRVPAIVRTKEVSPLGTAAGRLLLGYLRILVDPSDDLAWRSILEMPGNRVGDKAISELHQLAKDRTQSFAAAVQAVAGDPSLITSTGRAVAREAQAILENVARLAAEGPATPTEAIEAVASLMPVSSDLAAAKQEILVLADTYDLASLPDFLAAVALRKEEEEDVIKKTVNIMTAHKAKGLDACIVIIPAAEEELIPGGNNVDEERRLFYVSLSRARHVLFITHARNRYGQQAMSGTPTGGRNHQRTTFLGGSGLAAVRGAPFAAAYKPDSSMLSPPSKGGVSA